MEVRTDDFNLILVALVCSSKYRKYHFTGAGKQAHKDWPEE